MYVNYRQLENGLESVLNNLKRYKSEEDYRRLTAMYALKVVRDYGNVRPFESKKTIESAVDHSMLGVDEERKSTTVSLIIWVKNNHETQRRKAMRKKDPYEMHFTPGEDPYEMYFDHIEEFVKRRRQKS